MVLKTYARLFTQDIDGSLAFLQTLLGKVSDYNSQCPKSVSRLQASVTSAWLGVTRRLSLR